MKDGNLFHHEEQVLAKARELQEAPPEERERVLAEFQELTKEYSKLCRQSKSLVNISDMMQKDLNILNERIDEANDEIRRKNEQLEDYSRKLSEALESSQKKYRDIFESAVEGIFRIAPSGKMIEANPSFASILGFPGAEPLLEAAVGQLAPVRELHVALQAALDGRDSVSSLRVELYRNDGSPLVASLSARAICDASGGLAYYEGLLADITQREAVEHAERERRAAEAASMAKSRFLAKMSHEIRTPMNAIIGLTESLLRSELGEQQREHLVMVQESGEHLLEIINDILDFAKLETGRVVLERIDFDITRLLQSCLGAMRTAAGAKGLGLTLHVAPDVPPTLRGDPGRLRQVLNNLLSNAVKFTESGVVDLALSIEDDQDAAPQGIALRFVVTDTGIGVAPEHHERIFLDFTQSDDSTFRQYGGTGLGLSICRELVELMQGRIWVSSTPGQGSQFSFTAVFSEGDAEALQRSMAEPAPTMPHLRVLMAEDSPVNRTVTRLHLESLGHTVLEAADGAQALELLAQDPDIDLVLMDVEMPHMDGLETVKRLRQGVGGVRNPDVPVVAMTAHAFAEARESCLEAGMDHYISKPLKRAELARVLRETMEGVLLSPALNEDADDEESENASLPVLDTKKARQSQGLSDEEFGVLFAAAFQELQQEFAILAAAMESGDQEQKGRSAHTMKTVAASIGATACSRRARNLERLVRGNDASGQADVFQTLCQDMQDLKQAIENLDDGAGQSS